MILNTRYKILMINFIVRNSEKYYTNQLTAFYLRVYSLILFILLKKHYVR